MSWFPRSRRRRGRAPAEGPELPAHIALIRQKALQGHVLEQVQWGDILLSGRYQPRDPAGARQWFAIAAGAGYAPAHNMLGRCHHFGWGCPKDLAQAAVSYETAASLGDLWGCYNLGILAMRGLGIPRDLPRAFALFRSSAERGHAKSMNLVGRFTEEGWCTARDPAAALSWYRRSAEGGDYRGQHNYATALLAAGAHEEALDWWSRAVEDATSDVLLAMDRVLHTLDGEQARHVLVRVRARLASMGITNPDQAAVTDRACA